jgi:hypothetical protein
VHYLIIRSYQGTVDIIGLYAALAAIFIGFLLASLWVRHTKDLFEDSPLKLAAIRRYKELLALDLTPDEAIQGAAGTLGLPPERIRAWVTQHKGTLPVS